MKIQARTAAGETGPAIEGLLADMGRIQHLIEDGEGWRIEARAKEILYGLGFRGVGSAPALGEFSSGWQMRIELARLLLREPSALLLDEPTNDLDIESSLSGRGLSGSPTRGPFCSSCTTGRSWTTCPSNRRDHPGRGRSTRATTPIYLREKEIRVGLLEAAFENQQKMIRETERFVERFRAKDTKARQVQSG